MDFLRALETIRCPLLNHVFSVFTMLGEETVFIVTALVLYWCINKKLGLRVLVAGLIGNLINSALKITFRIPRPWVLDKDFTIVETARGTATGYSFPSGHTQIAVTTAASILPDVKKRWLKAILWFVIIAVPFSRMYLGVHTPLDTGVALVIGLLVAFMVWFLLKDHDYNSPRVFLLCGIGIVLCLVYCIAMPVLHLENVADPDNLYDACKNGAMMLGCCIGFTVGLWLDKKYVHFDVKAPLWVQVVKVAGGLAIVMIIRLGFKAIFGTSFVADGVRYGLITLAASGIWPMAFKPLCRLAERKG